jgi:hypothetical protein
MNARVDINIDSTSLDVQDKTNALLEKSDAILGLIIDNARNDISGAAWAVRDMISEVAQLQGWR